MTFFKPFVGAFVKFRRLGLVKQAGLLRAQGSGSCIPDHRAVVRVAAGMIAPRKRFKTVTFERPTETQVKQALMKAPCLFVASNIAQKSSNYTGHHAIALIEMLDEDNVLLIDLDNTINGNSFVFSAALKDLLNDSMMPFNEDLYGEEQQVDSMLQQPEESSSWCPIM